MSNCRRWATLIVDRRKKNESMLIFNRKHQFSFSNLLLFLVDLLFFFYSSSSSSSICCSLSCNYPDFPMSWFVTSLIIPRVVFFSYSHCFIRLTVSSDITFLPSLWTNWVNQSMNFFLQEEQERSVFLNSAFFLKQQ